MKFVRGVFCGHIISFLFLSAFCNNLQAQQPNSLKELLDKVTKNGQAETVRNFERELVFRTSADERNALLAQAEAEVLAQERSRDTLRAQFDENEKELAELQAVFDRRSSGLGELFATFHEAADDAQSLIFSSLISLERPERKQEVADLAETEAIPTIAQMQKLWELLIEESALSGEVSKFEASFIDPDGSVHTAGVVRVGTFNVIAGNKYLNYFPENNSLIALARQPSNQVRSTAENLSRADSGEIVTFTIDPSRGALLGLLVQSPSFFERIQQGGAVGFAIILVAIFGLLIVSERFLRLNRLHSRMSKQLKDLDVLDEKNPIGRAMAVYYANKHLDLETMSRKLQEVIIHDMAEIRKGLPIVKVLAAVAPLMGLLGTVVGMIGTFQTITLFGTGDPKLMAGGISQALITTVLGLCAAIPLLLTHSLLSARVTQIGKVIGEQAAGLMAKKAESDFLKA